MILIEAKKTNKDSHEALAETKKIQLQIKLKEEPEK